MRTGKKALVGIAVVAVAAAAVAIHQRSEENAAAELIANMRWEGPARVRALGDAAIPALREQARREIARATASSKRCPSLLDATDIASGLTTTQRDAYLEELIRRAPSPALRSEVLWELHRAGSPATAARLVLEELHGAFPIDDASDPRCRNDPGNDLATWGHLILDRSPTEPLAYPWLRERLADPQVSPQWRQIALTRLAGSGVRADLDAVLARRAQGRRLASIADVWAEATFDLSSESAWLDVETEDGKSWATVTSGLAGDGQDVWLVSNEGIGWGAPRYLGQVPPGLPAGTAATLASGDSDDDGWDDALERELGTDPLRADSDGDDVVDGQDPSPLVARRPSGNVEEVLAAAFAAYFGDYEPMAVPIVVSLPDGIVPFELTGALWVTFPVSACAVLPRPSRYKGQRVELAAEQLAALNLPPDPCAGKCKPRPTCTPFPLSARAEAVHVSFSDPEWPPRDVKDRCAPPGPEVLIAPNGVEARTMIQVSVYASVSMGVIVHLRRFDGVWVVVGIDRTWIT